MTDIERRRVQLETKRMLYFGKIVGPWWRDSVSLEQVNTRFASFLTMQSLEEDPILRAAFTCLVLEKNRLIAFIPHNSPPFAILKSDKVALSEDESAVARLIDSSYVRPTLPYFTTHLELSETLRPKTIGKMMMWVVEDTDTATDTATTK